jgi:hypothetical protein
MDSTNTYDPSHQDAFIYGPIDQSQVDGNASLNMKVGRGMGESYVWENFPGIPVEIIKIG